MPSTLATMRAMSDDDSLAVGFRRSLIDQTDELARSLAARTLATTEQAVMRTPKD